MDESCKFTLLDSTEPSFDIKLREILERCYKCDGLETQCGGQINKAWTKGRWSGRSPEVKGKKYLLYYSRDLQETIFALRKRVPTIHSRKVSKFCGFLVGYKMKDYFYIDLVCSANRKGAALIRSAEGLATRLGCTHVALRAAGTPTRRGVTIPNKRLMSYYYRKGFKRAVNACDMSSSRSSRASLRALNVDVTEGSGWWMSKCLTAAGK
jgi:hypothetical protein